MGVLCNNRVVLSNSNYKERPNFKTYFTTDSNAGGNAFALIQAKRRIRQMKFPSISGRHDVDSFNTNLQNSSYKKWNDDGDYHSCAPYRDHDSTVDPVSNFISAGGEVDKSSGHDRIKSLVQLNRTPQSITPQSQNSIRGSEPAAPSELKRQDDDNDRGDMLWNSRKTSDICIRSKLGGWTSDFDPRQEENKTTNSNSKPTDSKLPDGRNMLRDRLAHDYIYNSSTQRSYSEVPWDTMLPRKSWPPTSTLEIRPDMVSHRFSSKKYEPVAEEWQCIGRSLDRFQLRRGYYKTQPINFGSACQRMQQIPLYGGSIGAENVEEIDNSLETFHPFTVKRVVLPQPSETAHRPNIPGYSGHTLWLGQYSPAHTRHSAQLPYRKSVSAHAHRSLPFPEKREDRLSEISRTVTPVPPYNPFNTTLQEQDATVAA